MNKITFYSEKGLNDLIESGINYFAVSSLEEALEIRKYNKDIPVLCVEPIELDCIDIAIKNNITLLEIWYWDIKNITDILNKALGLQLSA